VVDWVQQYGLVRLVVVLLRQNELGQISGASELGAVLVKPLGQELYILYPVGVLAFFDYLTQLGISLVVPSGTNFYDLCVVSRYYNVIS